MCCGLSMAACVSRASPPGSRSNCVDADLEPSLSAGFATTLNAWSRSHHRCQLDLGHTLGGRDALRRVGDLEVRRRHRDGAATRTLAPTIAIPVVT